VTSQSRMQGDQKFLVKHKSIDPAMADAWKKEMTTSFLGEPARELAEMFGYHDLDPPAVLSPKADLAPIKSQDSLTQHETEADELLARLDDLSDDEVTALLNENLAETTDD